MSSRDVSAPFRLLAAVLLALALVVAGLALPASVSPAVAAGPGQSSNVSTSPTAFISTWRTTGPSESVTLPLADGSFGSVTNQYNFTADWGDGSSSPVTNASQGTHTYASAGDHVITIEGTIKGFSFNNGGDKLKLINVSQWGTLNFGNNGHNFFGAANFNATATDVPDFTGVTTMTSMFRDATTFNGPIGNWPTGNIQNMSNIFLNATSFDQPIGDWDTGSATEMQGTFSGATSFNQSLANWDVRDVSNFNYTFEGAAAFNGDVSGWEPTSARRMRQMFSGASHFNQDIGGWSTGDVGDMTQMFSSASAFNQDIGGWQTGSVTSMYQMFSDATAFNQDLSGWTVTGLDGGYTEEPSEAAYEMLYGTSLSTGNYDKLLVSWGSQNVNDYIIFGAGTTTYSAGPPTTKRSYLRGTKNWTMDDGGQSTSPGAPTAVTGTPGVGSVTVSWAAAPVPNIGDPVTDYTVTARDDELDPAGTCTWQTGDGALDCVVSGLTGDSPYTFTVTATNLAGTGPASAPSGVVTPLALTPSNDSVPTISGSPVVGQTFTSTNGSWSGNPTPTFTYQWQRCTAVNCASASNIGSATNATYVAAIADIDSYLRLRVTGTNGAGTATAYSAASGPISGIVPNNTVAPVVTAAGLAPGDSVSTSTGTWTGQPTPTLTCRWQSCTTSNCVGGTVSTISGATSASYQLSSSLIGKYVQAVVTGTNVAGATVATSNVVGPVASTGGLTPRLSTVTPEFNGFTFKITNYDSDFDWSATVAKGTVQIVPTGSSVAEVRVTGLAAGASARATVQTSRSGFGNGSASKTGTALTAEPYLGLAPTVDQFVVGQPAVVNASVGTRSSAMMLRQQGATVGTVSVYLNGKLGCRAPIVNGVGRCAVVIKSAGPQVFTGTFVGKINGKPVTGLASNQNPDDPGSAATVSITRAGVAGPQRCRVVQLAGHTQARRAPVLVQQFVNGRWRAAKQTVSRGTVWVATISAPAMKTTWRATDGRTFTKAVTVIVTGLRGDVPC